MAGASKTDEDEISGINVTPLVDVVLVLLVIFMITAPTLYQNALNVQLPEAKTGEDRAKNTLQISMDSAGALKIDEKPTTIAEILDRVARDKPQSAIILADKKSQHGFVIELIDQLKQQGIQKFSFGVDAKK